MRRPRRSGDTTLRILGTQFGAYDMLVLPVPIIEARITKAGSYDENLCGPTTWVSDEELTCVLPPGLISPLEVPAREGRLRPLPPNRFQFADVSFFNFHQSQ